MNNKKEENSKRISNFFEKNYKKMIKYSASIIGNISDAEDIIQDMMIELLEKENEKIWNENESICLSYVFKMVNSRTINYIKKKNNNCELPIDLGENINIEDEEYDYETDRLEDKMLTKYINAINSTKKLRNKYVKYYIKVRLYKMTINNAAQLAGKSKFCMYKNFKKLDEYVKEQMNKIDEINNNNNN
jgi:DNA-directed RNA polymerase specialized sigma24 family protein